MLSPYLESEINKSSEKIYGCWKAFNSLVIKNLNLKDYLDNSLHNTW